MKRHEYQEGDDQRAVLALAKLNEALDLFKQVGAVKTAERVRLAISSAKGAVRAVGYRESQKYYRARRADEAMSREFILREGGK